jgi:hypothetical protein
MANQEVNLTMVLVNSLLSVFQVLALVNPRSQDHLVGGGTYPIRDNQDVAGVGLFSPDQ